MTTGFRYQGYPSLREEERGEAGGSGSFGISGTEARLDDVPEKPQVPQSEHPLPLMTSPLEDGPDLERMASASLADVIEQIKRLLKFSDELDYYALVMGIALTYIQDLLPRSCRIFYVGFSGPKGSGKTTATRLSARVSNNGIKLEGVTYSALADACSRGKTLCLDEFDAQSEKCPELETIMRQGVALDAVYMKRVQDGKGKWTTDEIPCGGTKFFNWRNPIDDALLQRTLIIKMAPGASTRMIINNEAPDRYTAPLSVWFSAQSAKVRQNWTADRVRDLIEDKEGVVERRLDALLKKVPRQMQKGLWLIIICELFGWSLDDTIKRLIEKQPEDEEFDDYKELLCEIYLQKKELADSRGECGPLVMALQELKRDMEQRIKDKGLYPLRSKGPLSWTGLRQECGFVDGVNEKKDSKKGGKRMLVFDTRVLTAIGVEQARQTVLTPEARA